MKKKYYETFDMRLIFVLFCGTVFSLPYCYRPFWWDESITLVDFAQLPFIEIYKQYAIANNHIGYTILLKFWDIISGNLFIEPELHYRILSILIGLSTLIALFNLIKKIYTRNTAFFITLMFAVSQPFAIYSTAIRGYMLSLLLLSMALSSIYNIFKRKSTVDYILFFIISLATISVMPTNILGLYAEVFGIIPFLPKLLKDEKNFWKIFLCKNFVYILLIPLIAFLMFYLPLFNKILFIAKHNSGTISIVSSLTNIFLGFLLTFFQIFIFFFIVTLFFKKNNKSHKKLLAFHPLDLKSLILFGILFICLPVFIMLISKAVPFPRLFFQLWPLAMIYCAKVFNWTWKQKSNILPKIKTHHSSKNSRNKLQILMVLGIILLGRVMLNFNYKLSDILFKNGLYDDFLAPYYIRNYHPKKMILDIKQLSKQKRLPVYVSKSTDFASIALYSTLLNTKDLFKDLFKDLQLPIRKKQIQLPKNKTFYYIATFNEDVNLFAKEHELKNPILIKKYGFQNLYLFQ